MASLSQALRLGDLPPPHRTFQGHATHIIEWSMMLRPNDSWSTCILQGIATFLHYASRRSAGLRYTTLRSQLAKFYVPGWTPTLREIATRKVSLDALPFIGTPQHVADSMARTMEAIGGDGDG